MSQESFLSETTTATATATATATTAFHNPSQSSLTDYSYKIQPAIHSLSTIAPIPPSILSSQDPASALLHDPQVSAQISALLRHPDSGAGNIHLCRWFYDTFQANTPELQVLVLRFLPISTGLYLSSIPQRRPLAGFEAVLLALYAHETTNRNGQAITVNIADLSNSSIYHETTEASKNKSSDLNIAVISPSLEPHGTVRSTRRARIVGVALELYLSKIASIPVASKIDFCEFCELWAGQNGDVYEENKEGGDCGDGEAEEKKKEDGRIDLPWELLQPVLRILSHCLLGPQKDEKLFEAAWAACRSLYARSLHDINHKAILATGSLLRLSNMAMNSHNEIDYTEIQVADVFSL